MPFVHGKNAAIWLLDATGACRNISGDKNSVTLAWNKSNPETTTFGKVATQRLAGLTDATLSGAGIWNSDASSGIDAVFSGIMAASTPTLVMFCPAGSMSGCRLYSACYQLSKYDVVGPVNGVVAVNWEFQLASGSLTAAIDEQQIALWQSGGSPVQVSGVPVADFVEALYIPNPLSHANTYIERGHGIRQNCSITAIAVQVFDHTANAWAFRLFRYNTNTSLYDCIATRDFTPTVASGVETVTLSSPVAAQEGDVPGLYIPDNNYNRLYIGTDASKALGLPKYAADANITLGQSDAMASDVASYYLNLACYSTRPWAAFIGDSIFGGGNGSDANTCWHTDQENFDVVHAPGGVTGGDINLSVPYTLSRSLPANVAYQNFGKGGSTFATLVTAGAQLARLAAVDPYAVFIHCGVNDVAASRSWAAVEADLDTIRATLANCKLYLNEILPWQNSDPQAVTTRTFNANYATWCVANNVTLIRCHDEMALVRSSTGLLDDLNPIYSNGDSVHLSQAGVTKLAEIMRRYIY